MTLTICGICNYDRGMLMPITTLIGADRKRITLCPFCDEERSLGGMKVRVHAWPDKPETVVNIPHIRAL